MLRHGEGISIKATTTDFPFDSQIRGLHAEFFQDKSALKKQTSLLSYAIGLYMPCNTSWRLVDHVLMPIRMSNSAHWILCHFDIQNMSLNVYNSYHKIVRKGLVIEAVKPFSDRNFIRKILFIIKKEKKNKRLILDVNNFIKDLEVLFVFWVDCRGQPYFIFIVTKNDRIEVTRRS